MVSSCELTEDYFFDISSVYLTSNYISYEGVAPISCTTFLKLDFQDGNISALSVKQQRLDINISFFSKNRVQSAASQRF